jgi:two-component system sensor histidine kinase BarA
MALGMKVIDTDLALEQAGGNRELANELFGMLLEELPQHAEQLKGRLADGEFTALRECAHKLNGSATYCGVPALKAATETLEIGLKRGETSEAPARVDAVLEEIERVLASAQS